MKLITAIVISVFLTGCYQVVNSHDIERANIKCKQFNESVEEIESWSIGAEIVTCSPSGKQHRLQ